MICPEGYFTPQALEGSFFKALSSDRIAPQIYQSGSANFDKILSANRTAVLKTASRLFTHRFIIGIESNAQIFWPTIQSPFNASSWLLRIRDEAPTRLPESLEQAQRTSTVLDCNFAFLCSNTWSIDKEYGVSDVVSLHRNEARLLAEIDGFAVCFRNNLLPVDTGTALKTMAITLARQNSTEERQEKKRGRRNKVNLLVEDLETLYKGIPPMKTAKEVERDLHEIGVIDFGTTTLNTALSTFKNKTNTAS